MTGATAESSTKATLGLVAFIVFIDMIGIGLIVPVMPSLLESITGGSEDQTAQIGGWLLMAYATMQFLFAPIIGGLSDRFGRRPVLLVTVFLLGIDYLIMAFAPDLWWLFVGRILSGIMGASWAAANSCIADLAGPEDRGKLFGILGGAGASGFVFGPAIGGFLGDVSIRAPFFAAAALGIGGAIIGYFALRETLPPERRRAFTIARANPFGTVLQMAKIPIVLGFLGVIFLMQLAAQSTMAVWSYYTRLKFDWGEGEIGIVVGIYGLLVVLAQAGLTSILIKRYGARRTAILGLVIGLPSYLISAFAFNSAMMIAGVIVGSVAGVTFPALQQMMSERIAEDAQGELQGAVASTMSMTSIFGPIVMTSVFAAYADDKGLYFPGAPFICAAVVGYLGLALLWQVSRGMAR
ncbi:MAG: TCR/Tet family MFS transporter [Pseudomonadota bacterium]